MNDQQAQKFKATMNELAFEAARLGTVHSQEIRRKRNQGIGIMVIQMAVIIASLSTGMWGAAITSSFFFPLTFATTLKYHRSARECWNNWMNIRADALQDRDLVMDLMRLCREASEEEL